MLKKGFIACKQYLSKVDLEIESGLPWWHNG